MPDHILGDVDGNELLSIVYCHGVANEFRQDGGSSRPSANNGSLSASVCIGDFADEKFIRIGVIPRN
jgi:hypothetical protein